jgi:leucyl-tRNA synthetase
LAVLIAPFAPFMAEELWHALGNSEHQSVHSHAKFPVVNEQYLTESSFDYPVSVNGKVRANLTLPLDLSAEEVQQQTLHHETIQKWTNGAAPKKFIFVKGKIINVVV